MTCAETRELFVDLEDGTLDSVARRAVDEHLRSCETCRHELHRYRSTIALLGEVERPRAPAGFVDRVMDRVRPRPWYRRLGAHLLVPLPVKLPIEAAAIVLVAIGAVYVFQNTPELREAASVENLGRETEPSRVVRNTPPGVSRERAAPARTESAPDTTPVIGAHTGAGEPPRLGQPPGGAVTSEGAQRRESAMADAPASRHRATGRAAPAERLAQAPTATAQATPPVSVEPPTVDAPRVPSEPSVPPAPRPAGERARADARRVPEQVPEPGAGAGRPPGLAAPRAPGVADRQAPDVAARAPSFGAESVQGAVTPPVGSRAAPAPSVTGAPSRLAAKADAASMTGRLTVSDRGEGLRAVEALARRYGATVISRHDAADTVVLEFRLTRSAYRPFVGELTGLGQWTVDRELASLPDEPVVRIRVERAPGDRPRTSDAP